MTEPGPPARPSAPLARVLIANRGEIAVRIARAAAGLGTETVAVYPPVDAESLHVRHTTTSVELAQDPAAGPVAAYLDVDAVVEAAVVTGCDGLHPGYGFLAEQAALPRRCAEVGITFVGPSAEAIALFGDKVRARELARTHGVPVVPGSDKAVADPDEARAAAEAVGYPVMLKAAAGGGGRGMREVADAAGMAEAFERCSSEALAAFGDGSVFVEHLVRDPRHVEVQILADAAGRVVHLYDRDCSVQRRHQKVVEIAPAGGLDPDLRASMFGWAVTIAAAGGLVNAATVEFLVDPDQGAAYFIECNPRIQVEHTVTEQVLGVDLVEAQFRIAGGATLAELGLADQAAVGTPVGVAVQCRLSVTGPGTLTAYKEPSGPGVRVDAIGYAGYTPPPQFDPLLAKIITTGPGLEAALDRARRALNELQVTGATTNRDELRAIVDQPAVRAGDARTTLLDDTPLRPDDAAPTSTVVDLLDRHAPGLAPGRPGPRPAVAAWPELVVPAGDEAVVCPTDAAVVSVAVVAGDTVALGDPVAVVSAMKMETHLTAPCDGTVGALLDLDPGAAVPAGTVVAVIHPGVTAGATPATGAAAAPWAGTLDQVADLHRLARERLAPGSDDPGVVRQRSRGKLTCRERIDELLDDGSFREVGSVAGFASYDDDGTILAFTPANHVGGQGLIETRPVVVCADDFTSRGGHADGAIGAKSLYLDRLSTELRLPSVRLLDGSSGGGSVAAMVPAQRSDGESTAKESRGAIKAGRPRVSGGGGSFLPGHLGSTQYTRQLATVPVVNVLMGSVVGIGAAKAVLGHFSVMVRDIAQLFVAGPPVVSHAVGYDITKEELGGWHIHCRNGAVDNLAETEEDAIEQTRRFLSYLPSSVYEAPPVLTPPVGEHPDRAEELLAHLIPRNRTTTFDIRRVIELLADRDSFFEVGPLWGTDQVVGFVRFMGHPMGVIASDSQHVNGGALTADGCDKLTRHLDLCDLFHLPVLNLVDNPGFAVGVEHEEAATIRKGGEWMVAFAQTQVPIFTVIMRRSFGVAGNNYATPRAQPAMRVVWPSADVGGIPPEGGIEAAYKRQLAEAEDPAALRAELEARIESVRGPLGPLSRFEMEEMVDPRETRRLVCEWLVTARRQVSSPDRLGPRGLQFRP
ncbi:MAG: carboxyl transferase domain-containing protein [Acidimicrobiales bacterium]